MVHIVKRYSFNVPTGKTPHSTGYVPVTTGGHCPSQCEKCQAITSKVCKGCVRHTCMDRDCQGLECSACATMCYRATERVASALEFIGGFEVDAKEINDTPIDYGQKFIPAIQKRIGNKITSDAISIPFYSIFDFKTEKPICQDIRDYFRIKSGTRIIINFYMKDDKICTLFEYMLCEKFIRLIKSYSSVNYWHTPCFSVFNLSNSMDQVLNWKRQWWVGDLMRHHGLKVIQECLYSIAKSNHIIANIENALEIVDKKQIKNIGQCAQLDTSNTETYCTDIFDFYSQLPYDISLLITGISENRFYPVLQYHENSFFSNYSLQYLRS